MTERLLQFIWQFQHFNRSELRTEQGDLLQVIFPGSLNHDQGPDFLEAKIRLQEATWAGNIELHLNTSDWLKHSHQTDANYKNIILHVVWKNDDVHQDLPLLQMPTLELQPRVSSLLLQRYEEWMNNPCFIPCEKNLHQLNALVWISWKERLAIERFQRKSAYILQIFSTCNHSWEETLWWMMARNFGIRVNAEAFEAIARSIPLNVLSKHKNQIHQLEALLFGQAGLLDKRFNEDYPVLLQKEYRFYRRKYNLTRVFVALKFLRMRPSAFPTLRLAQLAMLIHQSTHLFAQIKEAGSIQAVENMLNVAANDYWNYHYRFDDLTSFKIKNVGDEMAGNIIINTIVPVLFAYGLYHHNHVYMDKAMKWLQEVAPEKNRITRGWIKTGIKQFHAYDSQSLIELKTQYCDHKRCLDCAAGNALLKT